MHAMTDPRRSGVGGRNANDRPVTWPEPGRARLKLNVSGQGNLT